MNVYIPWSLVTYVLGFLSCVAFILIVAKAGKKKQTKVQEHYKTVIDLPVENPYGSQCLEQLQKQVLKKGDGDV